jgi:hypothetical protein
MNLIAHRINSTEQLANVPQEYGVEIDVRAYRDALVLSHDPYREGESLAEYLSAVGDRGIVFNIKESGIEDDVVTLADAHDISEYFLLDAEFPYIYTATREQSFGKVAIRFSEAEPIETAIENASFADWVWVDTNTTLPLKAENYDRLKKAGYDICLVCPSRWGRPDDVPRYLSKLDDEGIQLDAVMTSMEHAETWSSHF